MLLFLDICYYITYHISVWQVLHSLEYQVLNSEKFSVDTVGTLSVNTRRYLDVDLTFFECYGRQMDVKTTSCAYWAVSLNLVLTITDFLLIVAGRNFFFYDISKHGFCYRKFIYDLKAPMYCWHIWKKTFFWWGTK